MIRTAPEELFYWEHGQIGGVYIKDEPDVVWSDRIFHTDAIKSAFDEVAKVGTKLSEAVHELINDITSPSPKL